MTGTAAGNITPSSFVVVNTATDNQYILASGNTVPIAGISGIGTRYPPYSTLDDTFIAISGENFRLFQPPEKEAALRLGGTVTAGDLLTSDANGFGVTASSNMQVGARAKQAGVSGGIISVQPLWGVFS